MKKTIGFLVLLAILIALAPSPKKNDNSTSTPAPTEQAKPATGKRLFASASNAEVKTVMFTIRPQLGQAPAISSESK